jgi:hypothetical protein
MTKKYVDVARVNTEITKKFKVLQEGHKSFELKSEQREVEIEKTMKESHDQMKELKNALECKDTEIDRLKLASSASNDGNKEVRDLKNQILNRDKEIAIASHEAHSRYVQDLKKKDLMMNEAQSRINYLSQKANEWYHAFRESQQVILTMRDQKGVPRLAKVNTFRKPS